MLRIWLGRRLMKRRPLTPDSSKILPREALMFKGWEDWWEQQEHQLLLYLYI